MKQNRYSIYKIFKFPEKIQAFQAGLISPPLYVRIKPTNHCCHDCGFCVYRKTAMHGSMNVRDEIPTLKLLNIISELSYFGIKAVTFSGGGEPLMHPGIAQTAMRCALLGVDYSIITNGQFLCGTKADAFSWAKWIRISCDYTTEKQFTRSRGGNNAGFRAILNNAEAFTKKVPSADLGVNFIVTKENIQYLAIAARLWKNAGAKSIRFSPVWTDDFAAYHFRLEKIARHYIAVAQNLGDDSFEVADSYHVDHQFCDEPHCLVAQTVPVIAADQNVYTCHNLAYDKAGLIGSIKNTSFASLWTAKKTQRRLLAHNPLKACAGKQCSNRSKVILYNAAAGAKEMDNFV